MEWFCRWWPQAIYLPSSFLADCCFNFGEFDHSGSVRQHLRYIQIALLFQGDTSICTMARIVVCLPISFMLGA